MAPEWIDDFVAFRDYVNQYLGPKPEGNYSIDRIENYEGYFPGNIRWNTQSGQNHNSKRSCIEIVTAAVLLQSRPRRVARIHHRVI